MADSRRHYVGTRRYSDEALRNFGAIVLSMALSKNPSSDLKQAMEDIEKLIDILGEGADLNDPEKICYNAQRYAKSQGHMHNVAKEFREIFGSVYNELI